MVETELLLPYLPRLARDWGVDPDLRHLEFEGTLLFADLSGFTAMTERLAAIGRRGAEEVSSIISDTFAALLVPVYEAGGSLVKFGGDALFLMFRGADHELAAVWAAWEMRTRLRKRSQVDSSVGKIRLGMTSSLASGRILAFNAGTENHEIILGGPTVTNLMNLERVASTGQTLLCPSTSVSIPDSVLAEGPGGYARLARRPEKATTGDDIFHEMSGDASLFVPAPVMRRLQDGQSGPEHRRIAIGFVGISGVDALADRDPALAAEALHELVTRTQEACTSHGAWLLASDVAADGGKLILTAGAPVASGHDEASILLTMSDLARFDTPLSIRLGANHGTVFFGDIGPSYRRTLTVMGDTVNTAARLMGSAKEGSTLAASSMLETRHVRFEHGDVRTISLRGRKEPLPVADVTGPAASTGTVSTESLIGREAELATLTANLAEAVAGRGGVVEVVGPPGSGRSRLVGELLTRAGDVATVRAEATLHERADAFALIRRLFAQMTRIDLDSPSAGAELTALVEAHVPALLADLAFVARALGIEGIDETVIEATNPRYLQAITTRALVSLLTATGPRPLLLAVDDAHLADETSLGVLRQMGARARPLGWLICVTLPEHGLLQWPGTEPTHVDLPALDRASLLALATALTEDDPLSSHELATVVDRCEGNPLVLREILAARRDNTDISAIPTAVEGIMAMRIDQLDPARRRQLEIASVLGTVFEPRLYSTVAGALVSDLVDSWDDGILQQSSDGRIRFSNPLLRDVVYDRLPFSYRVELHRTVADTLQADPTAVDDLAFHLYRAERWQEAITASVAAGRDAEAHFASLEAVQWYETALASAERAPLADPERGDLWTSIGDLKERAGQFDGAAEAFKQAESLAATPAERARLLIRRSRPLEKLGRYPTSLACLTRAKTMAPETPDVVAMATARYGGVRYYQGRHREAIKLAQAAIAASGPEATLPAEALALMILDMARSATGEPIDGSASRRAMQVFEQLGDLDRQARVTNNLGMFAFFAGDWDEAARLYDESRQIFERIGDEVNASYGAVNLAEIWAAQGRHTEADELFREVRRIWRAAGDKYGVAYIEGQFGIMAAFAGRLEEATVMIQRSIEGFSEIGARAEVAEAACHLVETRLLVGDTSGARSLIAEHDLENSAVAGSARLARLTAIIEWAEGTEDCLDAIDSAIAKAQEVGSGLDELRLLEVASRAGLPLADPVRQQDLTITLGMAVSPVYPLSQPS